MSDLSVKNNEAESRFEVFDGETRIGFAAYQKATHLVVFTHTEIDPGHEGRGVGSTLVRAALDSVRAEGLAVLPICPFVHAWMARHPDYADLDYRRPQSTATD
jgi:predicted GNAT family acetyltransferase